MDRPGTLPVHRAQAVGAGVAAADDDDVLVFGGDELPFWDLVPFVAAVLKRKELHREVDAGQLASRHPQVARRRGAAGEHDGVERVAHLADGHVDTDVATGAKRDALFLQNGEAAVQEPLLHLELGNPVPQQASDPVGSLQNRHRVARVVQLIRGGEARRA